MFVLSLIVTIVLFLILSKVKNGTYNNPLVYYLVFWGLFLLVSNMNPYGLFDVSLTAYLYLWTTLFCFSLGFIIISNKKKNQKFLHVRLSKKSRQIFIIFQILVFVILLYYYYKYTALLGNSLISDARIIRFTLGYLFTSYTEYLLFNYFITTFLYYTVVTEVVKFVVYRKYTLSLLITIISIVVYGFIGLGRFIFFDTAIFLVIGILIHRNNQNRELRRNNSHKITKSFSKFLKSSVLALFFIYFMVLITANRMGSSITSLNDFFYWIDYTIGQAIIYFTGPFRAFDHFLSNNIASNIGLTLGRSTFGGIEEILNNILILLGINIETANSIFASFTVDPIIIGDNLRFNALYTGLTNFYLDGRLFGIIFISIMYGMFVGFVWNYYNRTKNIMSLALLVFIVKSSLAYIYRWDFNSPTNWLLLFIFITYTIIYEKKNNSGGTSKYENSMVS